MDIYLAVVLCLLGAAAWSGLCAWVLVTMISCAWELSKRK
jgi:hypothetical protein